MVGSSSSKCRICSDHRSACKFLARDAVRELVIPTNAVRRNPYRQKCFLAFSKSQAHLSTSDDLRQKFIYNSAMATAVRSFAKINIGLAIGPLRDDNFHNLRTVYQTVALHDTLKVDVS